jgi:LysM repeat protein
MNPKEYATIDYRVKKGDTIGHIAEWFHCRAADIRNWNNLPYGRSIRAGATLTLWVRKADRTKYEALDAMSFADKERLRTSGAKTVAAKSDSEPTSTYVVRKGDTLEKIARAHGVSIAQLKRWNTLRKNTIIAGQELVIHEDAANVKPLAAKKPVSGGQAGKSITYVVKKGDTVWSISRRHEVEPEALRSWNALRKDRIYEGQELVIYVN